MQNKYLYMNKLIFTAIFCFAIINTVAIAQTYSGGSGIEADPYLISSHADMQTLATAVNNNASYSIGKYFLQTQDITRITTIIGSNNSPFQGIFDGGGYKITVSIDTSASYVGVFGYINDAAIQNLSVAGRIISHTNSNAYAYVGGVCGYANSSNVTNCYNIGDVSSSSSYPYVGGICGYVYYSTVTNCYNTGTVLSSSSSSSCPYAGGICGYLYGATANVNNCIAANTTIIAIRGRSYNSLYAGRIAGYMSGTVKNCRALASLQINKATRSSLDANSKDGKDVDIDADYFLTLIQILKTEL
jgi:hypothetical protein